MINKKVEIVNLEIWRNFEYKVKVAIHSIF
jgi:hypothetical protein